MLAVSPFLFDTWLPGAGWPWVLFMIPVEITIVALSAGYVCVLVLLFHRARWRRIVGWLAPLGRMALTNYLMHSVFFVILFYGVGFGLLGKVGLD